MISDGKEDYELVYSMRRIQMIEAAMGGKSFVMAMSGVPAVTDLLKIASYGMRKSGRDSWISPTQGVKVAEDAMESAGFMALYKEVSQALERDCGFLFLQSE